MTENSPQAAVEPNRLLALEQAMARFAAPDALVRMGGRVVEVSATHYRVRGLNTVQLGTSAMTWSQPVAVRVARPTFRIAR